MKKAIFLLVVLLLPISVFAQPSPWLLEINGFSFHTEAAFNAGWRETGTQAPYREKWRDFNSINTGVGLRYDLAQNLQAFAGVYRNSYYRPSGYAGLNLRREFSIRNGWRVAPGLKLGFVSGYTNTPEESRLLDTLIFIALPNIEIGTHGKYLNIGLMPPVNRVGVLTLQGVIRFSSL